MWVGVLESMYVPASVLVNMLLLGLLNDLIVNESPEGPSAGHAALHFT